MLYRTDYKMRMLTRYKIARGITEKSDAVTFGLQAPNEVLSRQPLAEGTLDAMSVQKQQAPVTGAVSQAAHDWVDQPYIFIVRVHLALICLHTPPGKPDPPAGSTPQNPGEQSSSLQATLGLKLRWLGLLVQSLMLMLSWQVGRLPNVLLEQATAAMQ